MIRLYEKAFFVMIILLRLTSASHTVNAQVSDALYSMHSSPQANSYYISLNFENICARVHELTGTKLSLIYESRMSEASQLVVEVLDWKMNTQKTFSLKTSYGLNYYDIDLERSGVAWQYNTIYHCRYTDKTSGLHDIAFILKEAPVLKTPSVEIFVNPIQTDCANVSKSSISFVGRIKDGKSPYRITWYVINSTKTDLLYLPREEFLSSAGESPTISVDAFMDYHVMLHVEDACGAVGKQTVHVVCEENSEQVNTVYIQPLSDYPSINKPNR